jgi:NADH dehydrogenase (ubiquinone) 1 alpha subcomplex subunit 5
MRAATRLLASVRSGRLLQPGLPTGLAGLKTHPAPRTTLIYLYSATLAKLDKMPESSVYRQAAEALTKKRLKIIESEKPEGYDSWQARMEHRLEELAEKQGDTTLTYGGRTFVLARIWEAEKDERKSDAVEDPLGVEPLQGPGTADMVEAERKRVQRVINILEKKEVKLEPEPLLTAQQ